MYSILRDFAYGNINPGEHGYKRNREFEKAAKALMEAEEKLLSTLNEEEKKVYEQVSNAQISLGTMDEIEKFVQGYILGAAMIIEVMTGLEDATL